MEVNEPEAEPAVVDTGVGATGAVMPAEFVLTERPTAAATKSLDAMALRGLFASGDRRVAMIQGGESDRRKDVELYEEGDVFFADTWRILQIDAVGDRVILEHLGHGDILELTLYEVSAPRMAAAEPKPAVDVARVNEEQARADLLEAGVSADEVESVFEMLAAIERGEDPPAVDGDDELAAPVAVTPARERQPGELPAMPPRSRICCGRWP